jgi:hypothetical protein
MKGVRNDIAAWYDFSLGSDALKNGSFDNEAMYWRDVLLEMEDFLTLDDIPFFTEPDIVVITGNEADNPGFRKVIDQKFGPGKIEIVANDPVFAAAKGTAEYFFHYNKYSTAQLSKLDL